MTRSSLYVALFLSRVQPTKRYIERPGHSIFSTVRVASGDVIPHPSSLVPRPCLTSLLPSYFRHGSAEAAGTSPRVRVVAERFGERDDLSAAAGVPHVCTWHDAGDRRSDRVSSGR